MAEIPKFDDSKLSKHKVELHVHLDGGVRVATIWELAKKKGVKLEADTLEDLYDHFRVKQPSTLENYLKPFSCIRPVIAGDREAIERITFEFCEDAAKQKVLYCEVRYCPHLFSSICATAEGGKLKPLTPRDVVVCVNKALARGSSAFEITFRSILGCFRERPEWSEEILALCEEFKHQGVVGIDIAGDEAMGFASKSDITAFKRAFDLGIHRTAHAGEAGPASNIKLAINELFVRRVGHGYHVVDDDAIYREAKHKGIHFETCPYSSYHTGAVPSGSLKHPIVRFAEDNVSFSISRDDPALIQKTLDDEYDYLRSFGLKDVHFVRANFNAAKRCFLPADEKAILLQQLREVYGVSTNTVDEAKISHIPPKASSGD